jgi:hypothetical protein
MPPEASSYGESVARPSFFVHFSWMLSLIPSIHHSIIPSFHMQWSGLSGISGKNSEISIKINIPLAQIKKKWYLCPRNNRSS